MCHHVIFAHSDSGIAGGGLVGDVATLLAGLSLMLDALCKLQMTLVMGFAVVQAPAIHARYAQIRLEDGRSLETSNI